MLYYYYRFKIQDLAFVILQSVQTYKAQIDTILFSRKMFIKNMDNLFKLALHELAWENLENSFGTDRCPAVM